MADEMGDRAVVVPLSDPTAGAEAIVALHERAPIDAVVAVDDPGVEIAALASRRLGLTHSDPRAVAATRDKALMRASLEAAGIPQPRFRVAGDPDSAVEQRDRARLPRRPEAGRALGEPRRDPRRRHGGSDRRRHPHPRDGRRPARGRGVRARRGGRGRSPRAGQRRLRGARGVRQARPVGRAVLRGDDLRHTVAAPRRDRHAGVVPHGARGSCHRPHRRARARRAPHRRQRGVGGGGRGAVDRRPVLPHAAVRRRHRARRADPPPRVGDAVRPPRTRARRRRG